MEDRQTPGLYLELGDCSPSEAAGRASMLLKGGGVSRVSWWDNCHPEREDLPRRVPEGSTLIVAEVNEDFTSAREPAPLDVSAHHFLRHSRPSQGILTGRPTTGLLIVWISPRSPDLATQLRDWGDFVHIRQIAEAAIPGFTQISVYENTDSGDPTYMHFYEFDSEDPETTFKTMTPMVGPRLGGEENDAYKKWADWRAAGGRLFYCNTFRLLGNAAGENP